MRSRRRAYLAVFVLAALGAGVLVYLSQPRDRIVRATADVPALTKITADMLTVKGPGTGLKPNAIPLLIGVVAESPIEGDSLVPAEALKWRRS